MKGLGEHRRGSCGGSGALPPLRSAGGSCPLPKEGLFRGGSRVSLAVPFELKMSQLHEGKACHP